MKPRRLLVGIAGCLQAVSVLAQQPANLAPTPQEQVVQVDFSNPALSPSHWTLTIHPDGRAHFRSQHSVAPAGSPPMDAPDVDRDLRLSAPFAERVFAVARHHKFFNAECESRLKVAFQGLKRLSYSGPDGQGSCEFNYSKDREIQSLGDALVGVAATIIEGARLVKLEQHDRLGLDREMELLSAGAADGRFNEMGAIREILGQLAKDDAVLERVRKRARALLALADEGNQK